MFPSENKNLENLENLENKKINKKTSGTKKAVYKKD